MKPPLDEQPMLAKITKGEFCKYRLWQEDLFVEFDDARKVETGEVYLTGSDSAELIATIRGPKAAEFLRCFDISKGRLSEKDTSLVCTV